MGDYWRIFAEEVPADMGLKLTPEQIDYLTDALKGAHENYGMAHGRDHIPDPRAGEIKRLERELEKEKSKIHCEECDGKGTTTVHGPYHSATGTCYKCRGEGKVLP